MEIKERIKLNKLEYHDLFKNYIGYIMEILKNGCYSSEDVSTLKELLKDFKQELNDENEQLKFLLNNIDKIDEEELERILQKIDELNEDAFNYYDTIGDSFAAKSYVVCPLVYPNRRIKKLRLNHQLLDEIKGLTLSYKDIEEYYSKYECMDYLRENSKVFNEREDVGVFGVFTDINGDRLDRIKLVVPKICNLKTALINVHEYKHGIELFDYLGRNYPSNRDFEKSAKDEEERFIKKYIRNK